MTSIVRRVWRVLALPLISIVLSVIVGSLVIILSQWLVAGELEPGLAFKAYAALISGSVGNFNSIMNTLVASTPLLLGGLSVGLAFKGGLFNIGAQGQFLIGALLAVIVGVWLRESSPIVAIPLSVIAGMVGGALWGLIPGLLKATSGAHEVVTTIMLNFVAIATLAAMVSGPLDVPGSPSPITLNVGNAALPVILGRNGHAGLLFGPVMAVLYGWLLYRTTLGFEIRTVGANPHAARYAGMRPIFITALTMTISGLLAGLAGAIQILGVIGFYAPGITASVGFDSIAVALLGRSDPIGILFAAMLFGAFRAGAPLMQIETSVPIEVIDIIQALVILFLAADLVVRRVFRVRAPKVEIAEMATVTGSWGSGTPPAGTAR